VCGAHLADGVGGEATGGMQTAVVAPLHEAPWRDMVEDTVHQLKDVEARGAWTGPAGLAGGEGDAALLQADEAPVGEGDCADRGRQGWQGGGAWGSGRAVDVPWGRPDVWVDLCTLAGSVPRLFEERAGDR
jgi:hypothetical protein